MQLSWGKVKWAEGTSVKTEAEHAQCAEGTARRSLWLENSKGKSRR